MLFLLLAAAAAPQTAVAAERAFAADAQTLGQWTAFRKWAAADSTMFLPQPANAQTAMKDWRDPPKAIAWSPTASFVSCDGMLAANTGGWRQPDGTVGFFSTIWARQPDGGWRWRVDGGDQLASPRRTVAQPSVRRAACGGERLPMLRTVDPADQTANGHSADGTLLWRWTVRPDGERFFEVRLWNGRTYELVIGDHIAAPPPAPRSQPAPAPQPTP